MGALVRKGHGFHSPSENNEACGFPLEVKAQRSLLSFLLSFFSSAFPRRVVHLWVSYAAPHVSPCIVLDSLPSSRSCPLLILCMVWSAGRDPAPRSRVLPPYVHSGGCPPSPPPSLSLSLSLSSLSLSLSLSLPLPPQP